MKVSSLLDQIELELVDRTTRRSPVDRLEMLEVLNQELTTLMGMGDWEWTQIRTSPIVKTVVSKREYQLPTNFPQNFVQGGDDHGDKFLCKINDGSVESFLNYKSIAQFHSEDMADTDTQIPADYTILTKENGERYLAVHPLPDSTYEISGVWVPTDWELREENDLPPLPNTDYLKWAVLERLHTVDRKRELASSNKQQAFAFLQLQHARARPSRMKPQLGRYSQNDYTLMR